MTDLTFDQFKAVEMAVGTILSATIHPKSKKPAIILDIDFGDLGTKQSSAQITENYAVEDLAGRQVIAVMNFPPMRIAGVKSEVLVLAGLCPENGTVLLQPERPVKNGARIA